MEFAKFNRSWTEALRDSATKNLVIATLLVTNMIAVFGWFRSHETVILVPPELKEIVSVSPEKSSPGYKKAWAMYVANLMGNLTPGNVDFVVGFLGEVMAPEAYRAMKENLALQAKEMKEDSLSVRFEPQSLLYEEETRKAFVSGRFTPYSPSGKHDTFERTYEMQVEIRFGRPWITTFAAYRGVPRTLQQLKSQQANVQSGLGE